LYVEHTPIETWEVAGHSVFVKRDDLFARPPAPPISKLRGLRTILSELKQAGQTLAGCFEASKSRIGHGLAAACAHIGGIKCLVAYAAIQNRPVPASVREAERLGARVLPIRNNFVAICHRQATRAVESEGGWMVPFGFDCSEAVEAVAAEAARVPATLVQDGTLVVPCGSGVTLAGILRGLTARPSRVLGVSVGRSRDAILRCLDRHMVANVEGLDIREPRRLYSDRATVACPFPCDAHYDLKAWEVLSSEIHTLRPPILFWNVGG
jgi:1-aminocyclopropane-1-carboxylate deaminase/D-cysteine desulfhydrase-like pyridoxal-dependent ACC family enzyme